MYHSAHNGVSTIFCSQPTVEMCRARHGSCIRRLPNLTPHCVSIQDQRTALHVACLNGSSSMCNTLLQQGAAKPNMQDKTHMLALHFACIGGHYDIVEMLLQVHFLTLGSAKQTHVLTDCVWLNGRPERLSKSRSPRSSPSTLPPSWATAALRHSFSTTKPTWTVRRRGT